MCINIFSIYWIYEESKSIYIHLLSWNISTIKFNYGNEILTIFWILGLIILHLELPLDVSF